MDAIGRLINPDYVSDHFQVILKRCGLKRVRFHDLRHSCASLMLANGIQMKMIQDWLGHSDMSTTVNIKNRNTYTLNRQRYLTLKLDTVCFVIEAHGVFIMEQHQSNH